MGKTLDALRHLQEVERKLSGLRKEAEVKRRRVQACKRQLRQDEQELEAKLSDIRRYEVDIHSVELEVKAREEIIQKHRVALNQAKTNKEYAAIRMTINTEKADMSKLESRVLELMTAKDALQFSYDQLAAESEKARERRAQAEAKLEVYLKETGGECESFAREREQASEALPPTVVSAFDRAAGRLGGEALAMITRVNPKRDEYVCGGCNMAITLETVNALRTRDEVVQCNTCGRILCFQD